MHVKVIAGQVCKLFWNTVYIQHVWIKKVPLYLHTYLCVFLLDSVILLSFVFTTRCYASTVLAMALCLSVTNQCSTTRSSAIAEGPRNALCQLKSCQLPRNSAETTCRQVLNKSKLWSWRVKVGRCVINMCTQPWCLRVAFIFYSCHKQTDDGWVVYITHILTSCCGEIF